MVQELAKLHHLRLTWLDRFGNGDCNKDNNDDDDEHDHDDCDDENNEKKIIKDESSTVGNLLIMF